MFYRKSVVKEETIVVGTDNGNVNIHLFINPDEPTMDLIITGKNIPVENAPSWHLYMNGYSLYFEVREIVTELIYNCDDIDDFINCLDEVLLDSYCEYLIESSFDDYEDLHGQEDIIECEECEKKDSCEEYLKHKN